MMQSADFGQEQVQRLLERIARVRLREVKKLPHPSDKLRLVLGESQVPVAQELGVSVQHGLQ